MGHLWFPLTQQTPRSVAPICFFLSVSLMGVSCQPAAKLTLGTNQSLDFRLSQPSRQFIQLLSNALSSRWRLVTRLLSLPPTIMNPVVLAIGRMTGTRIPLGRVGAYETFAQTYGIGTMSSIWLRCTAGRLIVSHLRRANFRLADTRELATLLYTAPIVLREESTLRPLNLVNLVSSGGDPGARLAVCPPRP